MQQGIAGTLGNLSVLCTAQTAAYHATPGTIDASPLCAHTLSFGRKATADNELLAGQVSICCSLFSPIVAPVCRVREVDADLDELEHERGRLQADKEHYANKISKAR